MSERPPTPPCVPFGTRRFNRISAGTRTCRIGFNIKGRIQGLQQLVGSLVCLAELLEVPFLRCLFWTRHKQKKNNIHTRRCENKTTPIYVRLNREFFHSPGAFCCHDDTKPHRKRARCNSFVLQRALVERFGEVHQFLLILPELLRVLAHLRFELV